MDTEKARTFIAKVWLVTYADKRQMIDKRMQLDIRKKCPYLDTHSSC